MAENATCPDCGAVWRDDRTCEDDFHQLLYWESEFPEFWEVHHLMVLCYMLQHPHRYSPAGLEGAKHLLAEFLSGKSPAAMRREMRQQVDSGKRTHNIKGSPETRGRYDRPIAWTMTVAEVVAAGPARYIERVEAWAQSIGAALQGI